VNHYNGSVIFGSVRAVRFGSWFFLPTPRVDSWTPSSLVMTLQANKSLFYV
jgi:hypothetical protein